MTTPIHETIFDQFFNEGHELYYNDKQSEMTPAHKVAFHLGKLNYQVGNGGFGQWISNDYYKLASKELIESLRYGIKEGLEGLSPVYKMLLDIEKLMENPIDCRECEGTGFYPLEDGYEDEEECDVCYGKGEVDPDEYNFDENEIDKNDDLYYAISEDVLFDLYGQLVLLHIPEKERKRLVRKTELQRQFD